MMSKILALLMVLVLLSGNGNGESLRSLISRRAADKAESIVVCSQTVAQTTYDAVMPSLIKAFNSAWPSLAKSSGLDPETDVTIPNIKIPCKYGGAEICGAQAAKCSETWIQMDFDEIDGLSNLQVAKYDLGTISTSTTSCDSNSLPSGAKCGYYATPAFTTGMLADTEVSIKVSNVKFVAKCETFGHHFKETIVKYDKVTCKSSNAILDGTGSACGSNCNIFSVSVDTLKMSKDTKIKCSVSGIDNDIVNLIVPAVQEDLFNEVEPSLKTEINKEMKSIIGSGYPTATCN